MLPLVAIGVLIGAGTKLPVPHFDREYVLRFLLPDNADGLAMGDLPQIFGAENETAPLVVIDAGHGGRDPGAVGHGVREKDITLMLAQSLRDELLEQGGVRVAMTRDDDRRVALQDRPEIARKLGADLFISLHADSAGELSELNGASIYTLSRQASSAAAARFARRENNADRLNGLEIEGQSAEVSAILFDLSQRRVQEESSEFVDLILREGEGNYAFVSDARRAADLMVLYAPDIPSVLFETGFVTNEEDARRLTSAEGRKAFASMMTRTIRVYFARLEQDTES
jgi:N-acetylmuramoyl-L-alanine amidase